MGRESPLAGMLDRAQKHLAQQYKPPVPPRARSTLSAQIRQKPGRLAVGSNGQTAWFLSDLSAERGTGPRGDWGLVLLSEVLLSSVQHPCERRLASQPACFWCRSAPQALKKWRGTRRQAHVLKLRAASWLLARYTTSCCGICCCLCCSCCC